MATINQRIDLLEKQMAQLLPSDVLPIDKPIKKNKSTKKDSSSDEDKPKIKRINGYLLFSAAMRDEIKVKLTANGAKLKNQDIMTETALLWKSLSEEQRNDWKTQALNQQNA